MSAGFRPHPPEVLKSTASTIEGRSGDLFAGTEVVHVPPARFLAFDTLWPVKMIIEIAQWPTHICLRGALQCDNSKLHYMLASPLIDR